jgi:superfamily II DNA/RNA helicase
MSEQFGKATNRAKQYQQNISEGIHSGLGKLHERQTTTLYEPAHASWSEKDPLGLDDAEFTNQDEFRIFEEGMLEAGLVSNILKPVSNNIFFIQAGTGSGKTHAVLKAIQDGVLKSEDGGKSVIGTPTRAMAGDIQNTGNQKVSTTNDFVGLWIGGEDGKDIEDGDLAIAVTNGKLWDLIMKDPTLGGLDNYLSEEGHTRNKKRKHNDGLKQVDVLIIDEADAIDPRLIPALKWLSQVRPDMKIIFVSATLNVTEFRNIYQPHPEAEFIAPDQERPRPITVDFIDDTSASKLGLSGYATAAAYARAPIKVLNTWILGPKSEEVANDRLNQINIKNETPQLQSGESVIIFMPTISAVNDLSEQVRYKYGSKVEVRALHGKLTQEEIDKRLYDDLEKGKIGIFVCTDVVGRGVNFPDKFNINRTIDAGLRNRPQYDPITGREVLKVGHSTQADIKQGLGRAGRNTEDERVVLGFVMQPKENINEGMKNVMVSNDPTQLILESAGFLKRIQSMPDIPGQYKPNSLVDYLKTLDSNPQTSKQFEAKLQSSLNRLYGIQALDQNNNVTPFGEFLIKMKYPVDYGIMLFESLDSPHLSKIIRIVNLIDNLDYFITRDNKSKPNYSRFVSVVKQKYPEINSDLMLYAKIFEIADESIEKFNAKKDQTERKTPLPVNKEKQGEKIKELFDNGSVDELIEYVYKHNCGDYIGINLNTLADAHKNQERVYKSLDQEKITYGQPRVSNKTFEETLTELSLQALPATLMRFSGVDRKGTLNYTHLGTGNNIVIAEASESLFDDTRPEYLTCAAVTMDGRNNNNFYAHGVQPATLEDLMKVEKYTSWIVKKDPISENLKTFDPTTGEGLANQNTSFQDYNHFTTQTLKTETLPINHDTHPEIVNKAMLRYLHREITNLDVNYASNDKSATYYAQLAKIGDFIGKPLSIPKTNSELLTLHYKTKFATLKDIPNLSTFTYAVENKSLDLVFSIENYLSDSDFEAIDELTTNYPDQIQGIPLQYHIINNQILPCIPDDKDLIYKLVRDKTYQEINDTLKLPLHCLRPQNNPSEIIERANYLADYDMNQIGRDTLTSLSLPHFSDINAQSDLDKLGPIQFGNHPLTDETLTWYPFISMSLNGRCTIEISQTPVNIQQDRNHLTLVRQIKIKNVLDNTKNNFETVIQEKRYQFETAKTKIDFPEHRDLAKLVNLMNQLNDTTAETFSSSDVGVMNEFDELYKSVMDTAFYGQKAIEEVTKTLAMVKELYPLDVEIKSEEVLSRPPKTIALLEIDRNRVLEIKLVRNNQDYNYHFEYSDENTGWFFENPKCDKVEVITENYRKSESEIGANKLSKEEIEGEIQFRTAEKNVTSGKWKYGSFATVSEKRTKLYHTVINFLSSKVTLSEIQRKELEVL